MGDAVEGDDFESRDFRRGIWHQTATTVALLTSADGDRVNVMACEWAMLVTMSPMRFAISVGPPRVTHELIEASGEFGLSFCSTQQAKLSHVSGSYSLRDVDKWAMADFETYEAKRIGAPMIANSVLNVECRVAETLALGDHSVFIGEAQWARWDPELEPLLYHGGKYFEIGPQIPKS